MLVKRFTSSFARASLSSVPSFALGVRCVSSKSQEFFSSRATYANTSTFIEHATSLLPEAYFDETYHQVEEKKMWRKSWVVVGFTDEWQNVGDTKGLEFGGQSVLITKNKKGELKGFHNCCRHRASKLLDTGTKKQDLK